MRSPSVASRSRTRGWRTQTGPIPVMISRSGRWPWRTTRCWPVTVFRSACFARNSATSASMAWPSSARAPLRRISVRESLKAPGWVSLMTLRSDTAYHSFIGEVEALNTTTIRRLTPVTPSPTSGHSSTQHTEMQYPGPDSPLTYEPVFDPLTGKAEGILDRCRENHTCPKIVHTMSDIEYWEASGRGDTTYPLGKR